MIDHDGGTPSGGLVGRIDGGDGSGAVLHMPVPVWDGDAPIRHMDVPVAFTGFGSVVLVVSRNRPDANSLVSAMSVPRTIDLVDDRNEHPHPTSPLSLGLDEAEETLGKVMGDDAMRAEMVGMAMDMLEYPESMIMDRLRDGFCYDDYYDHQAEFRMLTHIAASILDARGRDGEGLDDMPVALLHMDADRTPLQQCAFLRGLGRLSRLSRRVYIVAVNGPALLDSGARVVLFSTRCGGPISVDVPDRQYLQAVSYNPLSIFDRGGVI